MVELQYFFLYFPNCFVMWIWLYHFHQNFDSKMNSLEEPQATTESHLAYQLYKYLFREIFLELGLLSKLLIHLMN